MIGVLLFSLLVTSAANEIHVEIKSETKYLYIANKGEFCGSRGKIVLLCKDADYNCSNFLSEGKCIPKEYYLPLTDKSLEDFDFDDSLSSDELEDEIDSNFEVLEGCAAARQRALDRKLSVLPQCQENQTLFKKWQNKCPEHGRRLIKGRLLHHKCLVEVDEESGADI